MVPNSNNQTPEAAEKPIEGNRESRREACSKEVHDIIVKIGPWNVNRYRLSIKYGFDWDTVDRIFKGILEHMPKEGISNIKTMGQMAYSKAMRHFERVMSDPKASVRDKNDASRMMNDTLDHFTRFLESYGLKDKIAEELHVSGDIDIGRLTRIAEESKKKISS
jgi:hypothetical protein